MSIDTNGQDSSDPLIGQSIAEGRYRIVRVIGEGGMGKVYLGEQKLGDRTRSVAIKTLQPDLAQDPQIVARFHREAGTVSVLEHPNTIKFFESGELADGKLFVAMEFIQGESLAHVIARGPFPGPRVEHILTQVCGSLQEAHEHGVVHRDLKPENIILTQKGAKGDFVKVLDFGIAKRDEAENQNDAKLTRQGMVLGTPPYMSPEQFTGQPLRQTSDIYSLAIVAYEMLTGRLPFNAATPWEWATKHLTAPPQPFEQQPNGMSVLPRHKAAVMRALNKDPAQRPQTTLEFLAEFTGNREAGTDWSASTSGQGGHASNQGNPSHPSMQGQQPQPGYFGAMPPTAMAPAMGGQGGPSAVPTGPGMAGQPGVNATMAVSYPTPQPFGSQQGYPPAPTNAGFAPVAPPPSNPGFNPTPGGMYNPAYTSHPGGYTQAPAPSSGGAGKFVAIGAVLLLLVGGGAFFALRGTNNSSNNSSNNNSSNNSNPENNNGNTGNTNPTPTPPPDPTPTQPQPAMNPIPTPQPAMNPIPAEPVPTPPPPEPAPRVEPVRPRAPSTPSICGQRDRIDELILNGRCSAAQALYRRLRSSGCRVSNDSFGSACPAP